MVMPNCKFYFYCFYKLLLIGLIVVFGEK